MIKNFSIYLENCDIISNYNNIQIYKNFLLVLSELGIKMNYESFKNLNEQQTRAKLNSMIDYFIAEGLIMEDPITGKIRLVTDEESQQEIEKTFYE